MGDGLISKRYIVLYQAVSPVLIDEVVTNAAMKERMWESLFLDSHSFDQFRKQRAVEAHLAATLNKATQEYDKSILSKTNSGRMEPLALSTRRTETGAAQRLQLPNELPAFGSRPYASWSHRRDGS